MMTDKYYEFANRYGIKNINLNYDSRRAGYYNRSIDYTTGEELVEMEMPRRSFEYLVDSDRENERIYQDQRDEARLRRQYPAIKDIYDKYKMLLELYR